MAARSDLKPYQLYGAKFLAERKRALLADEPGVGKTAQLIRACDTIGAKHVRVICPAIGKEHWRREFANWSNWPRRLEIYSYDELRNRPEFTATCDVLIPDESHYAKNPVAARTQSIYAKGGAAWHARYIWSTSGTPAPNNAAELWPMMRAFGWTKMGYGDFCRYFCRVDGNGKPIGTRMDHVDELRAILAPMTLRRKKKDVLPELGEIDIQPWYVEPDNAYVDCFVSGADFDSSAVREGARRFEEKMVKEVKKLKKDDLLAWLMSNAGSRDFATMRRYNAMLKAPAVFEQVMFELKNGFYDKIVIYGYHAEPMQVLRRKFEHSGAGAELIYGGTPANKRDAAIQRWKRKNGPRVMVASILSAGSVINLTAAHQGIMLEQDWVPGNNSQAMQRMHRPGQENPVSIRVAMMSGIDETVNSVIMSKSRELTALFD